MTKKVNILGFPVMKSRCPTCPFNLDERGRELAPRITNSIKSRSLEVSQICHHPRIYGKKETHLCRGARDFQLTLLHRLNFIQSPTDAAFDDRRTSKISINTD